MIPLKTESELETMRIAGRILARILQRLQESIKAGMTTFDIDQCAEAFIRDENVVSAFKGYRGFPANVCTSINEEIVHGIPSGRVLLDGDILSLDVGIKHEGFFSDAAITVPIGSVDARTKKLIDVTRKSLSEGIKKAVPDNRLFDISHSIQEYVEKNGFSVVRQFVGHGIGVNLHEEPEIPNFGRNGHGALLKAGMVFAIEPMVNMGTWESEVLENGWTATTRDKKSSAHFEHTVAITKYGPEILTRI